jgi:cytochrome c-type biogenesis protein
LGQVMQTRPVLGYGAAYVGGVVATCSPCILASIPLIIGFVGGYAEGRKQQAFFYSVTFVVGLALVMSILGAMAAMMGTLFGPGRSLLVLCGGGHPHGHGPAVVRPD